eukprot:ctg_2865.g646
MSQRGGVPVVPSRMALTQIKARLGGARRGHAMLKKKADALLVRFRGLLRQILELKEACAVKLREALFALTAAKYAAGEDLKHVIQESVHRATLRVSTTAENVAGVQIPCFECRQRAETPSLAEGDTGRTAGGRQSRGVPRSAGCVRAFGVAADELHRPGRGHQDHQPAGERTRECGHPALRGDAGVHSQETRAGEAGCAGGGGACPPGGAGVCRFRRGRFRGWLQRRQRAPRIAGASRRPRSRTAAPLKCTLPLYTLACSGVTCSVRRVGAWPRNTTTGTGRWMLSPS